MGLAFSFIFSASVSVRAAELQRFFKGFDSRHLCSRAVLQSRFSRLKIALDSMSEGPFAQEFLGSKADSVANCFHKRSASLLIRAGTWMETPT